MIIKLANAGKRYNREWIFRQATLAFSAGTSYAITGPNGSGKSTLLQAVAGVLQLSEGTLSFQQGNTNFLETPYRLLSLCAPYLDVIEEFTLLELLQFHQQFKPFVDGASPVDVIDLIGLQAAAHKQIRTFSSGMKQRVKLAQAILSNTPVLLLDEPCTNLDAAGINLYQALMARYSANRVVVVCSNDAVEYQFCTAHISITDYK